MTLPKQIVEYYNNGKTYRQIKKDLRVSNATIAKVLNENKIQKHKPGPKKFSSFSKKEQSEICSLYKKGLSSRLLAKRYKCSQTKILNVFKVNDIKRRTISESKRLYTIDENVFDELNEFSSYWIGFLMADGNLYINPKNSRQIQLSLHERDREHIEKFKSFLKTDKPIYSYVSRRKYDNDIGYIESPEAKFYINSKIIFEKLEDYGLTVRKSKTAKFSDNLRINRHLVRGMWDGDGSILISKDNRVEVSLVGSNKIIEQIRDFVNDSIKIKSKITKSKSIFRIRYHGQKARSVADFLYSGSNIHLDRKKDVARKLI